MYPCKFLLMKQIIFSIFYLFQDWFEEKIGGQDGVLDDDYYLIDCPGQIELYTHMKVMKRFVDILQTWNFRMCGVFFVDSHFMVDGATFLSGSMAALSGIH